VFAEDWWTHARPVLELHGYFRVRAELFHGFALGRIDSPENALWPQPADNSYVDQLPGTPHVVRACDPASTALCDDKTQSGADMRFRLSPELHISDNVRLLSQIDMLDNVVLGSTPIGYANQAIGTAGGGAGGYQSVQNDPYVPIGGLAWSQNRPISGINNYWNSVSVKRVWGEYATPLGELRFGRMPEHWGLGMYANSGDTYDADYQSTLDRIMFVTGIKSLDLYLAGAWDFPNEGPSSATLASLDGRPTYDLAQLDDLNQYVVMLAHRRDPELQKLDLARGDVVWNGGVYFAYRNQVIAFDAPQTPGLGATPAQVAAGYVRRGLKEYIPDLWLQLLYRKFRFEAEGIWVAGTLDNTIPSGSSNYANPLDPSNPGWKLSQWGVATQTEFRAVEDKLKLQFGFGWASGDGGLLPEGSRTGTLAPSSNGSILGPQKPGDRTYSEFRFNPSYRVDLIFFRNILGRIEGAYYFRPSVDYDFSRNAQGQRFGGGAALIWSRASEFIQTPGHKRDLGIEADLSLYYQSKDGALNDNPDRMGGFFTMLQYGVFFPLGGLGYMPLEPSSTNAALDTSSAHMLRWFIGILF
jgi:uncharacterized protein (TIGR04551 family)